MIRLLQWLLGVCLDHDDEIVETKELPSAFARARMHTPRKLVVEDVPLAFFSATIVTIVRCKNCGRVQHITTRGPA